MPIYEYCCQKCSFKFEKLARINDEEPPCPECSSPTNKLVSLFRSSSSKGDAGYASGGGGCSSCSSSNCSTCR